MGEVFTVRVPDLGEGVAGAEIIEIAVKEGDKLTSESVIAVLESDKAAFELPAECSGKLTRLLIKVGDQVDSGAALAEVELDTAQATSKKTKTPPKSQEKKATPARLQAPAEPPAPPTTPAASSAPPQQHSRAQGSVYAGPGVRKMARDLGVNLAEVPGSAEHGRIRVEDVQSHVHARLAATALPAGATPTPELPDFGIFGSVHREKISRIRRTAALNLHQSWNNIPHVTHHDEADITELDAMRLELRENGIKSLTLLTFLLRACARVLQEYPTFRSSYDATNGELVIKNYYDIGVAVDTPSGLLVPVVRAVDSKGLQEITDSVRDLASRARERKIKPMEMRGACFSISNLGGIGGTGFTPIVNLPEVAILGVSRNETRLRLENGNLSERLYMPLSFSYDHRVINGAEAARFVSELAGLLQKPSELTD